MKHSVLLFLLACCLGVFSACEEDSTILLAPTAKTLVIISDVDAGSDVILELQGAVRSAHPDVVIHHIKTKPFDIPEAAYLLDVALEQYPDGTTFVVLVEPGASTRKLVYSVGASRILVPDNGISSRVIDRAHPGRFWFATNPDLVGGNPATITYETFYRSTTLSLLADTPLERFGEECATPVTWPIMHATADADTLRGEILFTDNFGNCVTNITDSLGRAFTPGTILRVKAGGTTFYVRMGTTYSSVAGGENVGFFNGSHRLELAVNYASLVNRYGSSAGTPVAVSRAMPVIGILAVSHNPVSDAMLALVRERLAALGLVDGQTARIVERNANGDVALLPGLASELVAENADVVLSVTTSASQAAARAIPESIPVVFTFVTAPERAGLFLLRNNITGLSAAIDIDAWLGFVRRLQPTLKLAGVMFNPAEPNSQVTQEQLQMLAPLHGFSLVNATVAGVDQIPQALTQLAMSQVGAVLTVGDNTIDAGMRTLAALAMNARLPLFGSSKENVADGALAAITIDTDEMARNSGDVLSHVLFGMPAPQIPVMRFPTNVIALNRSTAAALGYAFSPDLLMVARYIYP